MQKWTEQPPRGLASWGLLLLFAAAAAAAEVRVDFSSSRGVIRALHGGNNGPLGSGETVDLTAQHRELAIPFTRLHDSAWPYPDIVDVHAVFPDFAADPGLPGSYRFGLTDEYLRAITNSGARIVYRLGESIEHGRRKRYVHPPPDAAKWAAICAGIIRHFNEGWAEGHEFGIQYWEIWNEPDNRPAMWTGTPEEYFRLYTTTAKTLKSRWPALKLGGPSVGNPGSFTAGRLEPSEFLRDFIRAVKRERAPLDFFSWHRYTTNAADMALRARAIRAWLDAEGFGETESHLNEWNYLPDEDWAPMLAQSGAARERWYARQGGAEGAAFVLAALIELQDAPVDVANFYSTDNQPFGIFSLHGAPKKTFYAFKAFRALLDHPSRAAVASVHPLPVIAGISKERRAATVLLAHPGRGAQSHTVSGAGWPWMGEAQAEVFILDDGNDLERVRRAVLPSGPWELAVEWTGPGAALIEFKPR